MIETLNLHKHFGDQLILRGIDLEVTRGEVVVIIGPSGSGKSTLLRCINGLEAFEEGLVRVDGLEVRPELFSQRHFWNTIRQVRLKVGMVFQSFHLFPHLSVLENLCLAPIAVLGHSREEAEETGRRLLRRVDLQGKENQFPRALSGGEQQRVAIARALAMNLKAILFDEPTSSLDPELVGEVLSVISDLASEGYTMMIVTHQMHFAKRCAHRVVFLDGGRIVEEGPPEAIFENATADRTRRFLRSLLF